MINDELGEKNFSKDFLKLSKSSDKQTKSSSLEEFIGLKTYLATSKNSIPFHQVH